MSNTTRESISLADRNDSCPAGWMQTTVGEAYEICNQRRLPLSRAQRLEMQGHFPYYGPTGIIDYIDHYRFDGEFALIGEDGDHFLKWRYLPMTLVARGKFNVNNHAHVIGPTSLATIQWFQSFYANRDITESLTRQGASRYKLTKAALKMLPILVPPRFEQDAISATMDDIDRLIGAGERLIIKKQAMKQGLMQQLLTGKTRLPGFLDEWFAGLVGDVLMIKPGQVITSAKATAGSIPVIAGGKQPAMYIDRPNRFGPVITISASGASAGYLAFHEGPIFASDCSTIESGSYDIRFIYYALLIQQDEIYRAQTGGAQPHIHAKDVYPLAMNIPHELPEQTAIANVIADADKEIDALHHRLVKARSVKQGMMQELLTGRTRLPVMESAS